jgi:UDP-glucose/GDP-mannose dehydrogenase family, NAD binding domain
MASTSTRRRSTFWNLADPTFTGLRPPRSRLRGPMASPRPRITAISPMWTRSSSAHHEPDLSCITATAESIAPLRAGQLIILESTTYPGTTEEIVVPILERCNSQGLLAARAGVEGKTCSTSSSLPNAKTRGRHRCTPRYPQGHRRTRSASQPIRIETLRRHLRSYGSGLDAGGCRNDQSWRTFTVA